MADPTYDELIKRLVKAERNAQIARDWVEISNLHGRYNHLILGHNWDRVVDELFARKTPGVKCEIVESGVFHGLDGVPYTLANSKNDQGLGYHKMFNIGNHACPGLLVVNQRQAILNLTDCGL